MENSLICAICKKKKPFAVCPGCAIFACESCSCLELVGSGCGCVWPVYYCIKCVRDPMVNPNAVFKDPVQEDNDNKQYCDTISKP